MLMVTYLALSYALSPTESDLGIQSIKCKVASASCSTDAVSPFSSARCAKDAVSLLEMHQLCRQCESTDVVVFLRVGHSHQRMVQGPCTWHIALCVCLLDLESCRCCFGGDWMVGRSLGDLRYLKKVEFLSLWKTS